MQQVFICLDIGGTEIKGAALRPGGDLACEARYFSAHADWNSEALVQHFVDIVLALAVRVPQCEIAGLRMAFPGPFDYENGVCLLKGLAKYDALFGVNLRKELTAALAANAKELLSDAFDIRFLNDVGAFALGELHFGRAQGARRSLFVCVGTGCGSAFAVGGRPAPEGTPGMPPHGYLYNQAFRESFIDDYLSLRGLRRLSMEFLQRPLDGRQLAQEAAEGSPAAVACFAAFGACLREALEPFLDGFRPDCLVLGGQITLSEKLFSKAIREACAKWEIAFYLSDDTSLRTMQGLLA